MVDNKIQIAMGVDVARIQADMAKVSSVIGSSVGKMDSVFQGLKSSIAGIVSVGAFVELAKSSLEFGDEIAKATEKLGIGAEKLSAMRYAAELSDVSFEALQRGMKKFSQAIVEANAAGSGAATAFSVMGIATKDAEGKTKPLDVLFSAVANKFAAMEDGAGKVSLAVALFGRAGMDMIPVLNKGASGLAELEREAGRLGATISGKTAKQLEEANDNLKSFWMSVKGTAASITGELIGALKEMGDAFGKSLAAAEGEGFNIPGPDAKRFKAPPPPAKTVAPNLDEIKRFAEEASKLREKFEKLDLAGQVAFAEAMVQANEAEVKALADINKEYWTEKEKEDEKYRQMDLDGWTAFAAARIQQDDDMAKALAESDAQRVKDTSFEGLMEQAEAYGNLALAIETMNSGLGVQFALVAEGQSYIDLYKQAWIDANLAVADSVRSLYSGMQGWLSSSIQGLVQGTMEMKDVLKSLGAEMLKVVAEFVAKWVVSRVFLSGFGIAAAVADTMAMAPIAEATAVMWAPAATLASLATFGANAVPAMAGIGATFGLTLKIASGGLSSLGDLLKGAAGALGGGMATEGTLGGGLSDAINGGTGAMFASGTEYVPRTMNALVHEGERILTPEQNKDFTEFIKGAGSPGGGDIILDGYRVGKWIEDRARNYGGMKLRFT